MEDQRQKTLADLALAGEYSGIENRLVLSEIEMPDVSPINMKGSFLYISMKSGQPSTEELAQYVYYKIIDFCVPRHVKDSYYTKFKETNDSRYILDLTDLARKSLIAAKKSLDTSGEPGEILLFIILEAFLKAPRAVCKMNLKTNSSMPVHGTDAAHIIFTKETESLELLWGEAKLYKQMSSALDSICESIKDFTSVHQFGSQREKDIQIIRMHSDVNDESIRQHLLNYFDPYTAQSNNVSERYCCFVGFDSSLYDNMVKYTEEEAINKFLEKYRSRVETACGLFKTKIIESKIERLRYYCILLPFDSVESFRKSFYQFLGVGYDA
ncbi:MAG: DUF1837 domain-containing protein [Humidesulfovibrio sp.]|uniref:HamA C-terminal domain-containing protein n=1 Tax=Humidesulfovibrio sp. TaxID=2910988 RepID=UPI0027361CF2|nr:DUF1837 domain-containing protein [Humidesulfovibrio sp.]MDP2846941.1 DUF1837 domain-containing protein [Humidesulfovibrio sp.]